MEKPIAASIVEPSVQRSKSKINLTKADMTPKPITKLKIRSAEEIAARKAARIPVSREEAIRRMNLDWTPPRYGLGIGNKYIDTFEARDLIDRLAKQRANLDALTDESEFIDFNTAKGRAFYKKVDTQEKNIEKTSKDLKEVLDGYPISERFLFKDPPNR